MSACTLMAKTCWLVLKSSRWIRFCEAVLLGAMPTLKQLINWQQLKKVTSAVSICLRYTSCRFCLKSCIFLLILFFCSFKTELFSFLFCRPHTDFALYFCSCSFLVHVALFSSFKTELFPFVFCRPHTDFAYSLVPLFLSFFVHVALFWSFKTKDKKTEMTELL